MSRVARSLLWARPMLYVTTATIKFARCRLFYTERFRRTIGSSSGFFFPHPLHLITDTILYEFGSNLCLEWKHYRVAFAQTIVLMFSTEQNKPDRSTNVICSEEKCQKVVSGSLPLTSVLHNFLQVRKLRTVSV